MRATSRLLLLAAATQLLACPAPAGVCGDLIVDPGEACDAADDGCDAACHLTGVSAWTLTRGDLDTATQLLDVAVAPDGQIVVLGVSSSMPPAPDDGAWLLGLDPDGAQQWQAAIPIETLQSYLVPPRMVIDDDGFIYIHGYGLRRFTPRGEPSWQTEPESIGAIALTVVDDGVYAAGLEEIIVGDASGGYVRHAFAVHRHDAATGASVWERTLDDDTADNVPVGLAVLGATVHVGGWHLAPLATSFHPVHLTLDAATGASGPLVVDAADEMWQGFAAGNDGDLVIVGGTRDGSFVRRLAPDGTVRATHPLDLTDAVIVDLVIGGDDSIVVAGQYDGLPAAFLRGLTRAGEPAWSVEQAPADGGDVQLTGAAFGPGFLVAVGTDERDDRRTGWIRKIGPGPRASDDTTDTTDTADTTDGPAAPENVLECPQPPACGRVEAFSGCPGDPTPTAYTPNQACALGALASGDPVRIAQFDGCGDFIAGKLLLVRSDASAIVQHFTTATDGPAVDLEGAQVELASFGASELCTVKPPAYFAACRATFSLNCANLQDWVEHCDSPAPAACEP